MKILLVGSGKFASKLTEFDITGWTLAVIHNAWSIRPEDVTYFFASGDFQPAPGNKPTSQFLSRVRQISYKEYDGPEQRARFGRQKYGIGATMFFNSAYWLLGNCKPETMGFLGCSMSYPEGKANTFYEGGKSDPLRFGSETLMRWFGHFKDFAIEYHCDLVNFGEPGLMPYSCQRFRLRK